MIGKRYWATEITLDCLQGEPSTWGGSINFYDDFRLGDAPGDGPIATAGSLYTRYAVPADGDHLAAMRTVTDTLIEDADHLGIEFRDPRLEGAGELPSDWPDLVETEARRIGWGFTGSGGDR